MRVTAEKVPIAWELQLTIRALHPEWVQLRDLIEENKTFYPSLVPLLEKLTLALTGWSAPITGPCKSEPDKPFVLYDETRDRLIALDKNSELGLR